MLGFAQNEIDVADSIVFIDDDGDNNNIFSIVILHLMAWVSCNRVRIVYF